MRSSLLHGRWLYVFLLVVVVFLYGRVFLSGPPLKLLQETKQTMEFPGGDSPNPIVKLEVTVAKLQEAVQRNWYVALPLGVWVIWGLTLGLIGVVLGIRVVWRRRVVRIFRYRSRLPHLWSLEELGRLVVLLILLFGLFPFVNIGLVAVGVLELTDVHLWMLLAMFLLNGFLILFVWGFASAKRLSFSSVLGLSRRKMPRAVRQGLVGYAAIFPWVFGLLWFIARLCQQLGIEPPIEPIHELLFREEQGLVVGLTVLLACVVGPIAEEIFFRGVLFTSIRKHTSRTVAMVMSGAVFSAMHTNVIGFLPILILGCFLADLYERTGSLFSSMAAHILHNTFLVGLALMLKVLLGNG